MTELVITRGLPASGKTTFAREWIAADPTRRARLNRDDLRWNLYGVYWGLTYEQEEAVSIAQRDSVRGLLPTGVSVVIDDTNLRLKHARALADLAVECGADLRVVDFDISVETCVERDRLRAERGERAVGADVIRKMHARYLAQGPLAPVEPSERPQEATSVYVPDDSLPSTWIVDVDGTLAHMTERGPFEWGRVGEDVPARTVVSLVRALRADHQAIILVSGRDAVCRPETEKWLSDHGVPYDALFMRPEGDNRSDTTVKEEIFWRDVAPRCCVVGVLDDRDRVVAMWRRLGLTCAQVAPGDF